MKNIIEKITIDKFRGFEDIEIEFNHSVTAIIGKNGTMKTTLLGMLAQPFSLKTSPMKDEKPLTGGDTFNSFMTDKFKFSPEFDKPKQHKWTLDINNEIYQKHQYTCESIPRYEKGKTSIRFWSAEGKGKDTNYIQCPVIYLSMSRLSPIGEERILNIQSASLSQNEINYYKETHNKILITRDEIQEVSLLDSKNKHTLGPKTNIYDAWTISAGQDNIGKIILAVLSMKRLMEKYPNDYKGGIICIDEIESTMYPAAQENLIKYLYKSANDYKIQYFFTTHSMSIIEYMLKKEFKNNNDIVYLTKRENKIEVCMNPDLWRIKNDLYVLGSIPSAQNKIKVYCEDKLGREFCKSLLPKKIKEKLMFIDCTFSHTIYEQLLEQNIPEFSKESVIVVDGDVKNRKRTGNIKILKNYNNVTSLPGNSCPEQVLYDYFYNLSEANEFWGEFGEYTKDVCFKDYPLYPIESNKCKEWFKSQKEYAGRSSSKFLNAWKSAHPDEVKEFVNNFIMAYNNVAQNLGYNKI